MGSSLAGRDTRADSGAARALAASILTIALLTFVSYWPVRHNGFVIFDDEDYITDNAVVKNGVTLQGIVLAFTKSYAGNWHPLTWISHMIDVELFGLDPRGHHLVGLGIHLATAVLLLLTLRAMTGRAGPSFLVAALFAVHPLHVESVAWVAERKDVLSAFFWMLTTAAYLRYARRPAPGRFLPVLLFFMLGLMAKPMLVTLPLVLLLLDFWPLGRLRFHVAAPPGAARSRSRLATLAVEKAPLFALAAISGLVTVTAQSSVGLVHSLRTFPLAARLANAVLSPVAYLGKTVWPSGLSIFYPFTSHRLGEPAVLAAGGFLAAVSLAVLLDRRRRPWLFTGWLWYLVTLAPVIGLIQVGDQAMADRYTYIPLVGIFVAGTWGLAGPGRIRVASGGTIAVGTLVVLVLLTGLTRRQVTIWYDTETLFGHAARVTRDNWLALYAIGVSRERDGAADAALALYRRSIAVKPDFEQSRLRLVRLLHKQGKSVETLTELRAAVAALPRSHELRMALALALREQGSTAAMIDELRAAVIALPDDPELRMILAVALAEGGMDDEAITHLRTVIRLRPTRPDAYNNLAALLARRGDVDEVRALLRRALEIDPSYPDARRNLEALTEGRNAGGDAPAGASGR